MQKKYRILLVSLLALCTVLAAAWAAEAERESRRYAEAMEAAWRGSLLSALTRMEQVRANIDKALVSSDEGQSAQLISRISNDAAAVQGELSALPLAQSAMGGAVKLCNQLSDYADSLLLRADSALLPEDARLMEELSRACDDLLTALQSAWGQMRAGRLSFPGPEGAGADAAEQPIERAAGSIDYPTLIYDGPFSDAVSEDAPRGLGEGEITREEAVDRAAAFVGAAAEKAAFSQESGGSIPAYVIRVEQADTVLHLAVTRQGGQVLWMFPEHADFPVRYGLEDCKAAAQRFFADRGYGEMQLTFWQLYGGMATLSYAAVQDGVLLYPDLVKVQVRMDTLAIVGLEARHYLSSHTRRDGLKPSLSRERARAAVSERLTVTADQLCLIPLNGKEILCWEFTGEYAGQTYYVYIDAQTGRQRDIQRLVAAPEGPKAE